MLSGSVVVYVSAQRQIDILDDAQLITGAKVLATLTNARIVSGDSAPLEVDDDLPSRKDEAAFNAYADWRMFRIWRGDRLLLESDTGPVAPRPTEGGFHELRAADGELWRSYRLLGPKGGLAVEVGERVRIRSALIQNTALGLVKPLLLIVALVGLLAWFLIQAGLRGLTRLAVELDRRSARDFSPLPADAWPSELSPLVRTINGLLVRVGHAQEQERRFTDQAAHQMRTPLAVLKLQAQTALRAGSAEQQRDLVSDFESAVDRLSTLVEQLLMLSRLESETRADGDCDLVPEAASVLADVYPLASAKGVALALTGDERGAARADPTRARLILSNLIDNAVKHAPAGSEVEVSIVTDAVFVCLSVQDQGVGVPEALRDRVLEPFFRGEESGIGSGLGLALVAEAVKGLGGHLALTPGPGGVGLTAQVLLPRG